MRVIELGIGDKRIHFEFIDNFKQRVKIACTSAKPGKIYIKISHTVWVIKSCRFIELYDNVFYKQEDLTLTLYKNGRRIITQFPTDIDSLLEEFIEEVEKFNNTYSA